MHPNERIFRLYERWARGGLGLIVTGNVPVDRTHPESPRNVALEAHDEQFLHLYKKYAEACKLDGCKVVVQLTHAGRQAAPTANKKPKAPSAIPLEMEGVPSGMLGKPVEMTVEDIEDVKRRFLEGAVLCQKAGFGGFETQRAMQAFCVNWSCRLSNPIPTSFQMVFRCMQPMGTFVPRS